MGQIKIDFNGKTYGCIEEEDSLFNNRNLIMWFSRLNECCNVLKESDYVGFEIPETNNLWLEMNVKGDEIDIQRSKLIKEAVTSFVADCPFEEFEYLDWKDTVIKKSEFMNAVDIITRKFMDEIYALNSELKENSRLFPFL